MPVFVLVAVIVTPGIKAPVESDTLPPNDAFVDCAKPPVVKTRHNIDAMTSTFPMIFQPPNQLRIAKVNCDGEECMAVDGENLTIFGGRRRTEPEHKKHKSE